MQKHLWPNRLRGRRRAVLIHDKAHKTIQ
jgi:hypothetical protein